MKLPLWAQVQVERALDELKPGQIVIHTDGTSVRMVVPQLQYKEPKALSSRTSTCRTCKS